MRFFVLLLAIICSAVGARAAEPVPETTTVRSLLHNDFAVVGAIPSQVGPGLFLQKKDQLIVCFISETKASKIVATQYCKPVE